MVTGPPGVPERSRLGSRADVDQTQTPPERVPSPPGKRSEDVGGPDGVVSIAGRLCRPGASRVGSGQRPSFFLLTSRLPRPSPPRAARSSAAGVRPGVAPHRRSPHRNPHPRPKRPPPPRRVPARAAAGGRGAGARRRVSGAEPGGEASEGFGGAAARPKGRPQALRGGRAGPGRAREAGAEGPGRRHPLERPGRRGSGSGRPGAGGSSRTPTAMKQRGPPFLHTLSFHAPGAPHPAPGPPPRAPSHPVPSPGPDGPPARGRRRPYSSRNASGVRGGTGGGRALGGGAGGRSTGGRPDPRGPGKKEEGAGGRFLRVCDGWGAAGGRRTRQVVGPERDPGGK